MEISASKKLHWALPQIFILLIRKYLISIKHISNNFIQYIQI